MIELPGIGALVLDAMTSGRWAEARAIAAEDPRVTIERLPRKEHALLITLWNDYGDDADRKEHEGRCNVCGEWVDVVGSRDFEGYPVSVLGWHGQGYACVGCNTEDYRESRSSSRVPIAHGLESWHWPYMATGFGLEDLGRMNVAANLEPPGPGRTVLPCTGLVVVDRPGVPRWFQVHDHKGEKLFQGAIGCQRHFAPGEAVELRLRGSYR